MPCLRVGDIVPEVTSPMTSPATAPSRVPVIRRCHAAHDGRRTISAATAPAATTIAAPMTTFGRSTSLKTTTPMMLTQTSWV